jgi:transcriptional regulator of acetoin/glycerol metabolism
LPGPAPPSSSPPPGELPLDLDEPLAVGRRRLVERFERAYLTAIIARAGGNISEAARRAGMERISLYRMLKRLGLREPT